MNKGRHKAVLVKVSTPSSTSNNPPQLLTRPMHPNIPHTPWHTPQHTPSDSSQCYITQLGDITGKWAIIQVHEYKAVLTIEAPMKGAPLGFQSAASCCQRGCHFQIEFHWLCSWLQHAVDAEFQCAVFYIDAREMIMKAQTCKLRRCAQVSVFTLGRLWGNPGVTCHSWCQRRETAGDMPVMLLIWSHDFVPQIDLELIARTQSQCLFEALSNHRIFYQESLKVYGFVLSYIY